MAEPSPQTAGRLAENVLFFARTLRAAGLPVGPGKVLDAVEAVEAVGIERREDFYWALHAVFVNRHDQEEIFDQAFHLFWRNPKILERMMALFLPEVGTEGLDKEKAEELNRRLAEALAGEGAEREVPEEEEEQIEFDASFTYSRREILREMDFEKMSGAELEEAKRAIAQMVLPVREVETRRYQPARRGRRADLRATMRAALRQGGDIIPLRYKTRRRRRPPIVVLCDISGSMAQYSRMLLHFMHRLTSDRDRVYSFVFGTRLTNITHHLRHKDVDEALDKVSQAVFDWSGGTRIGACLHDFNANWSRRVLGQGAVVLLVTDGLDREAAAGLADEMDRLHKSCRRLIWLNPLLRWEGYEPKSMGATAMLPHVDSFRAAHNINSLADLAEALARDPARRKEEMAQWTRLHA